MNKIVNGRPADASSVLTALASTDATIDGSTQNRDDNQNTRLKRAPAVRPFIPNWDWLGNV